MQCMLWGFCTRFVVCIEQNTIHALSAVRATGIEFT